MAAKKDTSAIIESLSGKPKRTDVLFLESQRTVTYYIPQDIRERLIKLEVERIDSTIIRAALICLLERLEK